jgi:hypothetical protein
MIGGCEALHAIILFHFQSSVAIDPVVADDNVVLTILLPLHTKKQYWKNSSAKIKDWSSSYLSRIMSLIFSISNV